LASNFDAVRGYQPPISHYIQAGAIAGFANLPVDSDGFVRQAEIFRTSSGKTIPSLAQIIFMKNSGTHSGDIKVRPGEKIRINFLGPDGRFPTVSFSQGIDDTFLHRQPNFFKNKIVLVGLTASEFHENWPTPFSKNTPAVEIQAQILSTLISGKPFREPGLVKMAGTFLLTGALLCVLLGWLGTRTGFIFALGMAGLYTGLTLWFFNQGLVLPLVSPLILILGIWFSLPVIKKGL
jgi:CHASE2 domain-containing sensor protein